MVAKPFDWDARYVVPSSVRFRLTPGGALQVDGGASDATVEVGQDVLPWFLAFARPRLAAEAVAAVPGAAGEGERELVAAVFASWLEQGLLRRAGGEGLSRFALFTGAMEEFLARPGQRFPLQSVFGLQRPVLFYPGLETREVYDGRRFAWVAELEAAFPVIQAEVTRLLEGAGALRSVHREHTSRGDWAAAYLWAFGKRVEDHCRACPETVRLLAAIPGVAQFGTTMVSALAPRAHLAPHYGYSNAKLRCQLPIRVPGASVLKVGDFEIEQVEGRCIVFDDSFLHSAWNDGDAARFVLVFDFFHPDLTAAEVLYLSALAHTQHLAQPYLDDAAAGAQADWARIEA
jgi:Aspartyl/Asparaginyl beta-hydroxylase